MGITQREDPDAELVGRIGRGDEAALRALVARKLSRVHALAFRLLDDRGHADDVAQEAFLRVWKHAADWRPDTARFDTWLHRVVCNLCTDRLRKRREIVLAEPPEQADPTPGADGGLARADDVRRVRAAVAKLPVRQREAIVLHTYQELSNIEIAATMKISVDALESLLARARRALRSELTETGR